MRFQGQDRQQREMQLAAIGASDVSLLFADLPATLLDPDLDLPARLSEIELSQKFDALVRQAAPTIPPERSFLGGGTYTHYCPAAVSNIAADSAFSTAYTPYQAEASQGTLQMLFEYQSYMAEILAMDVVNASHYSGATALAEAVRLALLSKDAGPEGRTFAFLGKIGPRVLQTVRTYCEPLEPEFLFFDDPEEIPWTRLGAGFCGLCALSPDYFGRIWNLRGISRQVQELRGLFVVHTDPISCAIFEAPGSLGADIVTAEGQHLGSPPNFGGPSLGVFAVREALLRRLPGRLCGETTDSSGRRMFVLTLSTREQHIRREKAFSNICTNQGLMALRALAYLSLLGSQGLANVARGCLRNTDLLMRELSEIPGVECLGRGTHFREAVFRLPLPAEFVRQKLADRGLAPGIPLDNCDSPMDMLVCTTEVHTDKHILDLAAALTEVLNEYS